MGESEPPRRQAKSFGCEEPSVGLDQLAYRVIGAAIEVHKFLGPGFLESVYEQALCVELTLRGMRFARQVPIAVHYKGHDVEPARIDMVVEDCLVLELKTAESLAPIHVAQILSYLRATHLRLCILITFNVAKLQQGIKRVIHNP